VTGLAAFCLSVDSVVTVMINLSLSTSGDSCVKQTSSSNCCLASCHSYSTHSTIDIGCGGPTVTGMIHHQTILVTYIQMSLGPFINLMDLTFLLFLLFYYANSHDCAGIVNVG